MENGNFVYGRNNINSFLRTIENLPEDLFRQFLTQKKMHQEFTFSCWNETLTVTTGQGVQISIPSSLETVTDTTRLILENYPQGILEVADCPTGVLETIGRLNPKGLRKYTSWYVISYHSANNIILATTMNFRVNCRCYCLAQSLRVSSKLSRLENYF